MFGKILRENKYIYLIGDFNVNILHDFILFIYTTFIQRSIHN